MFDKSIEKMDFKELRSAVQLLYDAYIKMQRKYDDALYNLDGDNFRQGFSIEKNGNKVEVSITEDYIKSVVSSEMDDYATKSELEQTSEAIKTVVEKTFDLSAAVKAASNEDFDDITAIYFIESTDASGNTVTTYYYYDSLTADWTKLIGNNIRTAFEQTADGFKLRGEVLLDGNFIASKGGGTYKAKMNTNGFALYDGNENCKLELGMYQSQSVSGEETFDFPYIMLGSGDNETGNTPENLGYFVKLRKGMWIGNIDGMCGNQGEYPDDNKPVDGGATSFGPGIFFDFGQDKLFAYHDGIISEIGVGNANNYAMFGV